MGTVVGVFTSRSAADQAVDDLLQQGFTRDELSVVARGREGVTTFDRDYRWDDDDHATAGGGAVAGGLTGLLIGAGVALIPGVGPIFAAGPIAAAVGALMGGAAGAAIGGVAGGLIEAGVPEEEARYYDDRFREGGFLVTVTTSREDLARSVLARNGAHIRGYEGASMWQPRLTTNPPHGQPGHVHTPGDNPPHGQPGHVHTPGDNAGGTATGAVTGGLVGAAAGGALAGAAAGGLTGPAGAAIGAVVGATGGALAGAATDWDTVEPEYRSDFERRYPSYRWTDYAPSYRYGHESAVDPRYHGREWHDVESDLSTGWTTRYPSAGSWQDRSEHVRDAWTRARARRT
ncbi:MAG: hypothetical protein HY329_18825 [Chloroflexi bacterium]|nr:hypothetical protein [Chloroflexota bacterium]